MPETSPDRFELVPQKLIYGGDALGYHNGHPVLVPYALPGERVEVETVRHAKGMVYTRLLGVQAPSPDRVAAPCPYFGRCGGCHYQHLDARRQLQIKREILRETLRRIGHIDWPGEIAAYSSDPWQYRNQVQLKINREDGRVGFFAADSHHLVPIDECLISSPRLNAVIREFARPEWAAKLAGWSGVDLLTDDRDEKVVLTVHGESGALPLEKLASDCLSMPPGVAGVFFERDEPANGSRGSHPQNAAPRVEPPHEQKGETLAFENTQLAYHVGGFDYRITPGSFFQSSRLLLPAFVEAVTACETPGALALDLYAGVGLFTLPLARAFGQVVAVEANSKAAADLAANLESNRAANARAVASTAADFLRRYAQGIPDLVLLDPPRAGLDAGTLRTLSELGPTRIRYASCHPPTLARDLAFLLRHGYEIESVSLFDLFPQTFHIESFVKLRKQNHGSRA